MAIIATCLCGAQFKVPDDNAGEQMTCPMCATMVLVPSLDIGQIEEAEKDSKPSLVKCPDCEEMCHLDQMVDDDGELVCRRCFQVGPPKKPMTAGTKKLIVILIGVGFIVLLNILVAYLLFSK
jgi:DNA-directed RNA polymerase subunit RPC12/RpoP